MKASPCLVTPDVRRGQGIKLRNLFAAVLIVCQCGCGHTYFAWNKPLPVEHTEVYPLPSPGLLDWRGTDFSALDFGNSYDRGRTRQDMQRAVNRAVQTHFPKR